MKRITAKFILAAATFMLLSTIALICLYIGATPHYTCRVDFTYAYKPKLATSPSNEEWIRKIARDRINEYVSLWEGSLFKSNLICRCMQEMRVDECDRETFETVVRSMRVSVVEPPAGNYESLCRMQFEGSDRKAMTAVASISMDIISKMIDESNTVSVYKASYAEQQRKRAIERRIRQLESQNEHPGSPSDNIEELAKCRQSLKELNMAIECISNAVASSRAESIGTINIEINRKP